MNTLPYADDVIVETGDSPDACVIWLHGLGADGNDFLPVIPQLGLPDSMAIRFIFPNAPVRPITINQGYKMPGWYDITSLAIADRQDAPGIEASSQRIQHMIDQQQEQGIPLDRIVVAGFSQGGAVALHVALNYARPLAGVLALSTYLPACSDVEHSENRSVPVFMAHGSQDDVVLTRYGEMSATALKQQGFAVEWHEYAMPHSICPEEIADISRWLQTLLQ